MTTPAKEIARILDIVLNSEEPYGLHTITEGRHALAAFTASKVEDDEMLKRLRECKDAGPDVNLFLLDETLNAAITRLQSQSERWVKIEDAIELISENPGPFDIISNGGRICGAGIDELGEWYYEDCGRYVHKM